MSTVFICEFPSELTVSCQSLRSENSPSPTRYSLPWRGACVVDRDLSTSLFCLTVIAPDGMEKELPCDRETLQKATSVACTREWLARKGVLSNCELSTTRTFALQLEKLSTSPSRLEIGVKLQRITIARPPAGSVKYTQRDSIATQLSECFAMTKKDSDRASKQVKRKRLH